MFNEEKIEGFWPDAVDDGEETFDKVVLKDHWEDCLRENSGEFEGRAWGVDDEWLRKAKD